MNETACRKDLLQQSEWVAECPCDTCEAARVEDQWSESLHKMSRFELRRHMRRLAKLVGCYDRTIDRIFLGDIAAMPQRAESEEDYDGECLAWADKPCTCKECRSFAPEPDAEPREEAEMDVECPHWYVRRHNAPLRWTCKRCGKHFVIAT